LEFPTPKIAVMTIPKSLSGPTIRLTYLILLTCLLQNTECAAQTIDKNAIPLTPIINWTKGKDSVLKGFPKEYSKDAKKIADSMAIWAAHAFVSLSGFSASGSEIEWHALYLPRPANTPSVAVYQLKVAIPIGGGTGFLTIAANDLSILQQPLVLNGQTRWLIRPLQRQDTGVFSIHLDSIGNSKLVRSWLICYSDSLPFDTVSRREYFEESLKELNAQKDSVKRDINHVMRGKTAQQEEAYRQNELQTIDNNFTGNEREQKKRDFLVSYKPDSAFQEDTLKVRAAVIIEKTDLIKSLLESLKDLKKPAFVSVPAIEFDGLEDGMPRARFLAHANPAYFKTNIARERPQFLVITWQYDPEDADAVALGAIMQKELDFVALRHILQQSRPFYFVPKKK
jgi:hypothetical protein